MTKYHHQNVKFNLEGCFYQRSQVQIRISTLIHGKVWQEVTSRSFYTSPIFTQCDRMSWYVCNLQHKEGWLYPFKDLHSKSEHMLETIPWHSLCIFRQQGTYWIYKTDWIICFIFHIFLFFFCSNHNYFHKPCPNSWIPTLVW